MIQFNDQFTNTRVEVLRREEEEKLIQALAPQYGFEYINLHGYTINPEAIAIIPEAKAREGKLVVFDHTHNLLSIAVRNPNDPVTQKILAETQNNRQDIKLYMCSYDSLEHAWKRYADQINTSARKKGVFDIDTELIFNLMNNIKSKEEAVDKMHNIANYESETSVLSLVALI